MSNIPCEMIRDLMVLYDDSVCGEETKREIEAHLEGCESCKAYYKEECRTAEFELKQETDKDVQTLEKIKKRILFRQWMIVASVVLVCIGGYLFADKFMFWAPAKEIQVKELYQLANGSIAIRLQPEKFAFQPEVEVDSNGKATYKVGTTLTTNFNKITRTYSGIEKRIIVINQDQVTLNKSGDTEDEALNSIVYKSGLFDEELVIWERGQDIEPAPIELEKRFAKAEARLDWEEWSCLFVDDME